jgi:hypothetical protein
MRPHQYGSRVFEDEEFELDEIRWLLNASLARRDVRFVLALSLDTRQREPIGLKWSRLATRAKALRIVKGLQRQTWQHDRDDPHGCGAKYYKTKSCKEGCKRHTRERSPPCGPNCESRAGGDRTATAVWWNST